MQKFEEKEIKGKEILLVEDSELQSAVLKNMLEEQGFVVKVAGNGAEGLGMLNQHKSDIVIADILMPLMNGYEMCRQIRQNKTLKDMPVILLTQLTEPEDIIRGLNSGADNYVTKPYDTEYLLSKICSLLRSPDQFRNNPAEQCVEVTYKGKHYTVRAGRSQTMNLLLATYENAIIQNRELNKMQEELKLLNDVLEEKVKKRTASLTVEIAERRRIENELRASEARFRGAVESANDAVICLEAPGMVYLWNTKAEEYFNYSASEAIGKHITQLIIPERNKDSIQRYFDVFFKTGIGRGADKAIEGFACRKDGSEFPVEVSTAGINVNGTWNSISLIRDITERKKAEKKLKNEIETTASLLALSEATANTVDIDELSKSVVKCCCDIVKCDVSLFYLWDAVAGKFRPQSSEGLIKSMLPIFRSENLSEDEELLKKALGTGKPELLDVNFQKSSSAKKKLWDPEKMEWLNDAKEIEIIPLLNISKQRLGLLINVYREHREITERGGKLIQTISDEVSQSLEQTRLFSDTMHKTMELSHKIETIQVMHDIDKSILSTLSPEEILETSTRIIGKIIPCDKTTIFLIDKEKKSFVFASGFGLFSLKKGSLVPFGATNASEIIDTRKPQYIANLMENKEPLFLEKTLIQEGFMSHVRIPLTVKGVVIGILSVGAKRPAAFTTPHLQTLEKLASQISVALENARLITDMEELFIGTVKSLSYAIDAKSSWTSGHSERVTKYSIDVGKDMGLSEAELKDLELAAILHDVGKIGTYESILDKPTKLTDEEMNMIKQHPGKGADILSSLKQLKNIIPAVKHHHESYDGKGYPEGLKGEDIPLFARILAVADSVDAMSSDRPYRKGKAMEEVYSELKRCSETQFDPVVVTSFLNVYSKRT
ncbi:MAG: response regulator [Candidatus Schekmanbacteria bacterium]|nr:response regulator [Candidatus Schekmanbacteria bacterium]